MAMHGNSHDFNKYAGHHTEVFKKKFFVSLALTIPVLLYSDIVQMIFGWRPPLFSGWEFISPVLSSVIFLYGGRVFIESAYREIKAKLPGMMTLISLAISVAYLYSVYVFLIGEPHALFWELATLITIMLLGHWIEMRAVSGAQGALKELSKLLPDQVEVIRDGKASIISLEELKEGDMILVRPGSKIPADGVVIEGNSEVNESIATGESKPVSKEKGDEVIAGTVNGDGSLKVKINKIGEHTFLAGVMRLVSEAQASKSRLQILSDRAAYYLTVIAIVVGLGTLITWLFFADPAFAVERMVAVLVIACPHALGLAVPLVASISTTKAAQNGFLVKQRLALEAARNIDTVLFDKTGTLTRGEFGVSDIVPVEGKNEEDVLSLAAAVDSQSEHPIAKSILREAGKRDIALPGIQEFIRLPGQGSGATIGEAKVVVGSESLLRDKRIIVSHEFKQKIHTFSEQGKTVVYVIQNNSLVGAIALADVIREESRQAVRDLKTMGIKVMMMTGDAGDVARWVAKELRLDDYFARVMPKDKAEKVRLLQGQNKKVAMVGDGMNDAPALTQADLGVAVGAGTNVAIESAGIILVRNDPRDIVKIIKLSRLTYRKMIQNLFWATGYNAIAIPLAAGVFATWGVFLEPALAAALMSVSTLIVAVNAMLLRQKSL